MEQEILKTEQGHTCQMSQLAKTTTSERWYDTDASMGQHDSFLFRKKSPHREMLVRWRRYVFVCNDWVKVRRDMTKRYAKTLKLDSVEESHLTAVQSTYYAAAVFDQQWNWSLLLATMHQVIAGSNHVRSTFMQQHWDWASCSHTSASVTKQNNLVTANGSEEFDLWGVSRPSYSWGH